MNSMLSVSVTGQNYLQVKIYQPRLILNCNPLFPTPNS